MYSRSIVCVFCVVLFFIVGISAQTEDSGMIKTAKGILIVWNEPGNYFTIEIKSEKITPFEEPMRFQVDGKFLQIVTTEKKSFLKNPNDKTLDDKAILAAHRDWERDYIAGVLKTELKVDSEAIKLPGGQDALGWSYKMPKVADAQSAKRQLYVTVVKRDHVLVLNSALTDEGAARETKELLLQTLLTLKPSDKPLSLQKASEQVRKEN